ncbi:MAG: hypothetical protein E6Y83_11270 [Clostridium butyricum]|jgi:hypothetical protein|nr:hypothetical protein [Clostridium butyricum]
MEAIILVGTVVIIGIQSSKSHNKFIAIATVITAVSAYYYFKNKE